MVNDGVVLLGGVWFMVNSAPELIQYVGYLFGFLLAFWALDEYL